MSWQIILYESKGGQTPVDDFINSLQPNTRAKLARQIDLLEEFGPRLDMPNAQPIGGGVYELRVRGKQEVRVLYIFVKANNIYLLHGFIKKSQKISSRDLGIVFIRKKEVDYL